MPQQQINLYALLPKTTQIRLRPEVAKFSYQVLIGSLLLIYFVVCWGKHKITKQYHFLENQMQQTQNSFTGLTHQYPDYDPVNVQNTVTQLNKKLASKTVLINLLSKHTYFSTYLSSVADTHSVDVWLTEMRFDNLQSQIDLKGLAKDTEATGNFIGLLNRQPAFIGKEFEIEDISEVSSPVSFYITNRGIDL